MTQTIKTCSLCNNTFKKNDKYYRVTELQKGDFRPIVIINICSECLDKRIKYSISIQRKNYVPYRQRKDIQR